MASTLLNEQGWNQDAIERQLAHGERDAVRAAYSYVQHLPERQEMMQAWLDELEQLKAQIPAVDPVRERRQVKNMQEMRKQQGLARKLLPSPRKNATR